ncbi:MAG: hypothetical protein ABEH78_04205 [Haloferacaceae archaeon]
MASPREEIEALREQIEDSPDIGDADAKRLLEFSDRLDEEKRDRRHEKFLRHCTRIAEEVDDGLLAASLEDREAAEEIVDWIFEAWDNEDVNRNFRVTLRVYGKLVSEGDDELPPSIGWVPTHTSPDRRGRGV